MCRHETVKPGLILLRQPRRRILHAAFQIGDLGMPWCLRHRCGVQVLLGRRYPVAQRGILRREGIELRERIRRDRAGNLVDRRRRFGLLRYSTVKIVRRHRQSRAVLGRQDAILGRGGHRRRNRLAGDVRNAGWTRGRDGFRSGAFRLRALWHRRQIGRTEECLRHRRQVAAEQRRTDRRPGRRYAALEGTERRRPEAPQEANGSDRWPENRLVERLSDRPHPVADRLEDAGPAKTVGDGFRNKRPTAETFLGTPCDGRHDPMVSLNIRAVRVLPIDAGHHRVRQSAPKAGLGCGWRWSKHRLGGWQRRGRGARSRGRGRRPKNLLGGGEGTAHQPPVGTEGAAAIQPWETP